MIEKKEIALRTYVKPKRIKERIQNKEVNTSRILVFDTETTDDMYQNLKFGSFAIIENSNEQYKGIFYNPEDVTEDEKKLLEKHCKLKQIQLYTKEDFIENVFIKEVFYTQTLCIGFNLPFDIPRLSIDWSEARGKRFENGFSFILSKNPSIPRLKIKHIDSTMSFIEFGSAFDYNGRNYNFRGNFLDLKTLMFALTNEKYSLKTACKLFKTKHQKSEAKTHGKITPEYIEYNLNDLECTKELYYKAKEEYDKFCINLPVTKAYSPASIGKTCLDMLDIKSFEKKNPNFPDAIKGNIMASYYGGRSDVMFRRNPMQIVLLDFTSMYPTVCILQNLWKFIIAEKIETIDNTENVRKLLERIKEPADLLDNELWKTFNCIVFVKSNEDLLPVRSRFNYNEEAYNIGIEYLTNENAIPYALSDVIASKILNNKTPEIMKAIRFIPVGIQNGLKKVNILGVESDPEKQDFFEALIEERQKIKNEMKRLGEASPEHMLLDSKQKALKTIANAISYGIYIEDNPEENYEIIDAYGIEKFEADASKIDNFGYFFNPIMAVLITSASRLLLAIAESILAKHGKFFAFCDTDSMAVPPECAKELQDYFQKLNPYKIDVEILKQETPVVWCYCISAKRYVLYKKDDKIEIFKKDKKYRFSLHGLGHIENPFGNDRGDDIPWQIEWWTDILNLEYGIVDENEITTKYRNKYEIAQLSITSTNIMKRFEVLNKDKKIKPSNFFLVGMGAKKIDGILVKPMAPYSNNPQSIVYQNFVDYNSGKILNDISYWKTLDRTFFRYLDHPESKFVGNRGKLERRHIEVSDIIFIGKEANDVKTTGRCDKIWNK
ncbi:MAG: hypothetical protein HYW23_00500 [Candidatus Aenigmarchaeota archaeon]|nr:hypothetical protein [Candidatus Aenigmarchaeota archaeon]